jgi:type I restriction enzyme S subunit
MAEKQLPEGWHMVKFGDLAKHISKRVEPSETDLEIYVGLEHLDSDSLRIKRHGTPSDVAGQKLLVKKGQIIFGKRRAYQRKLGVAEWDCICSAHAMVLEANLETVLPEFLPFFMQSDVFMNRAVAISEGSLSPTIKWKVLEQQEFLIPDFTKQFEILKILKANLGVSVSIDEFSTSLDQLKKALRTQSFEGKELIKIGDIASVKTGATPRRNVAEFWGGNIPWMSSGEIHKKILHNTDEFITQKGMENSNTHLLPRETVVMAMNGQGRTRGTVAITEIETTCNQSIAAIVCDKNRILPMYLFFYLESKYSEIRGLTGEGRNGLNLLIIRNIKVPNVSMDEQIKAVKAFKNIMEIERTIIKKLENTKDICRALLAV